nr:MAG TPA: hypothetical protein [Caudoviricetes sp.]DAP80517.1 MAG TPA: hypothetical protein [Caudoviricetes sp.]
MYENNEQELYLVAASKLFYIHQKMYPMKRV